MVADITALIRTERPSFMYINPPFNFNHLDVQKFPSEVTGNYLLRSLQRRIGWANFEGRRLLDFGCGVRFAQTIINLGIDLELYAGIDTNAAPISWLKSHVDSPRFRFVHLNMRNAMYNIHAPEVSDVAILERQDLRNFDAACMFSVITHQPPAEAAMIFSILHCCLRSGGKLYFTALMDDSIDEYVEGDPDKPGLLSTYNFEMLVRLLAQTGWAVTDIYAPDVDEFQQHAFVCEKAVAC